MKWEAGEVVWQAGTTLAGITFVMEGRRPNREAEDFDVP